MKKLQFTAELRNRTLACVLGNIILGLGVAITKMAAFGNDPFNGMCMSMSDWLGIPYTVFTPLYNTVLFGFEILWGRKHIHIGTFINWFLLCYAVSFFLWVFEEIGWAPTGMIYRLAVLLVGLLVVSFGLSVYQLADLGVAPYDAIPLMVCERWPKIPFFWARVALDSLSTVVILLTGGVVGIGTLLTALCLGPAVHFFTYLLTRKKQKTATPS